MGETGPRTPRSVARAGGNPCHGVSRCGGLRQRHAGAGAVQQRPHRLPVPLRGMRQVALWRRRR